MAGTGAIEVVRAFFESLERRDWSAVEACLSEYVSVWWPATLERFEGAAFVAMNQAYPQGWAISVNEVVAQGDRVAARVRVDHDEHAYWCFGFYTVTGGVIVSAIESWIEEGAEEAPDWRAPYRVPA